MLQDEGAGSANVTGENIRRHGPLKVLKRLKMSCFSKEATVKPIA